MGFLLSLIGGSKTTLILGILVISTLIGGYFYISSLQSDIALLKEREAIIVNANKNLSNTIVTIRADNAKQHERLAKLNTSLATAETNAANFQRRLDEILNQDTPEKIEKEANNVIKNIFNDIDGSDPR